MRESTKQDETLVLLKEIVTQGWPEKIKDLPPELQPYWTFQEAITVADGLLLKGNRIIIPDKDRPQILKQIHEGHLGIQKCLQRAKATVYWPRLYDELKDLVTNCAICLKYSASNRKDSTKIGPPLGQEIPTEPWKKLATDLFTYDQANYLLVVDYTTKFPVVRKLTDLTARVVTEHMKAIFSEFGTPHSIVSDNGPCYAAQYFADAMTEWGVNHIKVSPHHHQANGLAEGYVCIKLLPYTELHLCQTNYHCHSSCCMAGDLKQISHSTQSLIQIRSWHYDTRTKMRQNQRSTSLWELMLCSSLHRTRSCILQS